MPIRACKAKHAIPAGAAAGCGICRRAVEDPRIADLYGEPRPAGPLPSRPTASPGSGSCRHLGAATGERRVQLNCVANPPNTVEVRGCGKHGACTTETVARATQCCRYCPDHEPVPSPVSVRSSPLFPPIRRRHLVYHVYPRHGGGWRMRLLRLRERIALFNGRRIVAVAFDRTTEHPDLVRDAMAGTGCQIIPVANNPNLREVVTFLPLFESVADCTEPGDVTLWAHAKGVTRGAHSSVARWIEVLESAHLDYWPAAARILGEHPVVGVFKKIGRGWIARESVSDWHYSGSWFWFRNASLFGKPDWRRIDRFWSGIEPYPSLHFSAQEAGCMVHEGPVPAVNLYDVGYWNRVIEPLWATWKAAHSADYFDAAKGNP